MLGNLLRALVAASLLATSTSGAPPGSPFIRRFSTEEIGTAPQFSGLAISADGLLYASGQGGLVEFDGQSWRLLTAGEGFLAGTATDDQGRIYVGGIAKVLRLDPTASGWALRDLLAPLALNRAGAAPFFYAQQDPVDRSLWFSAVNRLVRVDAGGVASVVRESGLTRLIPWAGRLLLRSSGSQVFVGWADQGKIDPLAPEVAAELEGIVTAVPGSATETMAVRAREFRRFTGLRPVEDWRPIPGLEEDNVVLSALKLDDERVVLGTQRGQALVLTDAGALSETWTEADGLTGGGIRNFRRDGQGGLWLATDNGLARVQIDSQLRHFSRDRGLRMPAVAMHRHAGRLWVGTRGGAYRQDDSGGFQVQPSLPAAVRGFCSDGSDLIVAGRSLAILRSGAVEHLPVPEGFAALAHPLLDPSGNLLVIPTLGAVLQFRRQGGNWVAEPDVPGVDGSPFDLEFAPDGALWVADSRSRVLRVPWKAGRGPLGPPEPVAIPGSTQNEVQELHFGVWRGRLWMVSQSGLHGWNPDTRSLEQADELGPAARGRLTGIAAPPDGALWLFASGQPGSAQSNRAWRVLANENPGGGKSIEVREYSTALLTPNETYGIHADNRDHLFIFGEGPIGVLEAERAPGPARIPPPVRIRRMRTSQGSVFEGGTAIAQPVLLPLGQRAVFFEFAAAWFPANSLGQSSLTFRSRLVSDDPAWSAWSQERTREFTNLPPGTYRFEAQASLTQSAGTAPVGHLTFVVAPFWWETTAARTGFALAGITLVAVVVRFLAQQRLHRRVRALEREARVETERLRIARDMHDDLGSSLAHIAVSAQRLSGQSAEAPTRELAEHIRKSALEVMSSARDIIWSVNPQNDTLDALADYLSNWVHRALGEAGIDCELDIQADLPDGVVTGPARNGILLATKEATHNVVKHSRARSAHYRIRVEGGEMWFVLSDDGRGLEEGQTPSPGSGLGLSSIQARLQALGGSASIESAAGQGAKVTLSLPLFRSGGRLHAGLTR